MKRRIAAVFVAACVFGTLAQTITIRDSIVGKTPHYVGFNPDGSCHGYADSRQYGDPNEYGTAAFWFKQANINAMRSWGHMLWDEGPMDFGQANDNDTIPNMTESDFNAAKAAVIANPLNNRYINWPRFNRTKVLRVKELNDMGITSFPVLRYRHDWGIYYTPAYITNGLPTWTQKWEWWEYCFAMAYLYAKIADCTIFEFGNEPDLGSQGGLTIEQQKQAIEVGHTGVRAAVKAATGKDAYIISCGVSGNTEYLKALETLSPSALDGISFHTYEGQGSGESGQAFGYLNATTRPAFNTEYGANANEDAKCQMYQPWHMMNMMNYPGDRLKTILLFKSSGGGGNELLAKQLPSGTTPTQKMGLLKPHQVYWVVRMLFRASIGAKDRYDVRFTQSGLKSASVHDSGMIAVMTRDSQRSFFTLGNMAARARTSTVNLPPWLSGQPTSVWIYDSVTYADVAWPGHVMVSGAVMTITGQPARSFVQVVWGTALDPMPAAWNEASFRLTELSATFPNSTSWSRAAAFADSFNTTPGPIDITLIDSSRYLVRSALSGYVSKTGGHANRYHNRLYVNNQDMAITKTADAKVVWIKKRFSVGARPLTIRVNMGYGSFTGNGDPSGGLVYRDDNGAQLGTVAGLNIQNSEFRLSAVPAESSYTPEQNFNGGWNFVKGTINNTILDSNSVVVMNVTTDSMSLNVYTPGGTLRGQNAIRHGLKLSGTGIVGLGKVGDNSVWFDNLSITSDGQTVDIGAAVIPGRTEDGVRISRKEIAFRPVHNEHATLELYNQRGALVSKVGGVCQLSIPLDNGQVPPGNYLIRLKTRTGSSVRRMIVP